MLALPLILHQEHVSCRLLYILYLSRLSSVHLEHHLIYSSMAVTYVPPTGFDITPIAILISATSVYVSLLCHTEMAHTATSWILDQAKRLDKQRVKQFMASLADRSATEETIQSYVTTTMFGFILGFLFMLGDGWIKLPIASTLLGCACFSMLPAPWRVWGYLTLHDSLAYTSSKLGLPRAGYIDDILKIRSAYVKEDLRKADVSDWEVVEGKDEVTTDAMASHREDEVVEVETDDTDDSWSFDLDTPSEIESSLLSGTSNSTRSVPAGEAQPGNSSVEKATKTPIKPEHARSSLDTIIRLLAAQDPRGPHLRLQTHGNWFMSDRSAAESPNANKTTPQPRSSIQTDKPTFEHLLRDEVANRLHTSKSREADQQQPTRTSHTIEKLEHQATDIIILRVLRGTDSQERLLVRIHRTTPFAQLKDKLRNKDGYACELMVTDTKRDFPVFDNETPSSVSFCPVA